MQQRRDHEAQRAEQTGIFLHDHWNRFWGGILRGPGGRLRRTAEIAQLVADFLEGFERAIDRPARSHGSAELADLLAHRALVARQFSAKPRELVASDHKKAGDQREGQQHRGQHGDALRYGKALQLANAGRKDEAQQHRQRDRNEDVTAEPQNGRDGKQQQRTRQQREERQAAFQQAVDFEVHRISPPA